jgi:hypothetical protein
MRLFAVNHLSQCAVHATDFSASAVPGFAHFIPLRGRGGNPWFIAFGCGGPHWAFPRQNQGLKKTPKRRLTKISTYCLISYVSQQNSSQLRLGCPAGAGAGGMGNSPRAACSRSVALHSVSITQFREGSFSALSATLRETREKGKLVAPCRAVSFLSFTSHQYPSANPALKNPSKPPFGTFTNEGQSRSMKANEGE